MIPNTYHRNLSSVCWKIGLTKYLFLEEHECCYKICECCIQDLWKAGVLVILLSQCVLICPPWPLAVATCVSIIYLSGTLECCHLNGNVFNGSNWGMDGLTNLDQWHLLDLLNVSSLGRNWSTPTPPSLCNKTLELDNWFIELAKQFLGLNSYLLKLECKPI
jgi:hypothetical protein